jgi:hypothetical protein
MNKTTIKKAIEILRTHHKTMSTKEMSWVLIQVLGNVSLDKLQALVKEWYDKNGEIDDAEKWITKSL